MKLPTFVKNTTKMKRILIIFYLTCISFSLFAQAGCTDPQANNYNQNATENDGSCTYDHTELIPQFRTNLADELEELSGMISYQNRIFGLADSGNDAAIFEFDTITGAIIHTKELIGTENIDWESMTIDDAFVYVGDTGNNKNGNRTDLVIYRFPIGDLDVDGDIPANHIERLYYHYENQTNFTELPKNSTRFDCESIVSLGDSIYLFTKDWKKFITRSYSIPKIPGNHTAILHDSLAVNGIITDATTSGDTIVILLGSSLFGNSFLEILHDYKGHDVFSGNKRQITVKHNSLGQPESLTLNANLSGFIGTEAFKVNGVEKKQAIFSYSILEYLHNPITSLAQAALTKPNLQIFPNPTNSENISFTIPKTLRTQPYQLIWCDAKGQILGITQKNNSDLDSIIQYPIPKYAKTGQNYLIIQAKKEKYIGAVQVQK